VIAALTMLSGIWVALDLPRDRARIGALGPARSEPVQD
jgi:hypothetical protein